MFNKELVYDDISEELVGKRVKILDSSTGRWETGVIKGIVYISRVQSSFKGIRSTVSLAVEHDVGQIYYHACVPVDIHPEDYYPRLTGTSRGYCKAGTGWFYGVSRGRKSGMLMEDTLDNEMLKL